jgi:hypothetical protein
MYVRKVSMCVNILKNPHPNHPIPHIGTYKGKSGRQREREGNVHELASTEKGKDTRIQIRG